MNEPTTIATGLRLRVRQVTWVVRCFRDDIRGATAIEYAMIGGLIFAVIAGSLKLYGSRMSGVYGQIGSAMAQVE